MAAHIKYSVIIPVYNREQKIARCLESLVRRDRDDIQILVIDDGSTDSSAQIIQKLASENKSIEYHYQENAGVSCARNTGLDYARGDYVTFVDSDDFVTETYFETLDRWTAAANSDLLVFRKEGIGGACPEELRWFAELIDIHSSGARLEYLTACRLIIHPVNKCFKNEIIQRRQLRFVEGLYVGEDFAFCMAYAVNCSKIDVEPSVLYQYDVSDQNSLSRKYRSMLNRQLNTSFAYIQASIRESALAAEPKERLMAIVDYLYIKNVFSCIAEEFKCGHFGYLRYRADVIRVCKSFQNPLSGTYCSTIHRYLRFLLKLEIYWPFYLVTYLVKGRKMRK